MTERSESTSDGENRMNADGRGEQPAPRETESERTALITDRGQGSETAAHEQPSTGAPPPWARGGTAASSNESESGFDVGQPQHGSSVPSTGPSWAARHDGGHSGNSGQSGSTAQQRAGGQTTSAQPGSGGSEAPTGYMPPVFGASSGRSPQAFAQTQVRTDEPMFEHTPRPDAEQSMSTRIRPPRVPRRASLQLKRVDPWSVLKLTLVLSVAGFFVWMVAVGVLYGILAGMGVWDQLNGTYSDLTSVNDPTGGPLISAGRVFGFAALIGLVDIVLITALATVGSFIYNVAADLVGGAEVTLSERD